ncbi:hypothetical protein [Desulfovibrio sp.]|uniref:hypothetical protein n=1 Tax=Desulfovibrio sp. TaxID=885 RepID=UPI002636F50F|nr:hypothetical protein [Desulfovibrio sp.]
MSEHLYAEWPQGLKDIADTASPEVALALAEEFGGVPIYIPKSPDAGCKLVPLIGLSALKRLASVYGGEWITVPRGSRAKDKKKDVRELLDDGLSFRETAIRAKVSLRYVAKVAAQVKANPQQLTLPL